mmetsp:Transcript_42155/g.140096  ORF Transcript_42155/g.140096 Transcript_42155/m.140096 type:complete len:604 (-) Transcript_42155:244-2055(-)
MPRCSRGCSRPPAIAARSSTSASSDGEILDLSSAHKTFNYRDPGAPIGTAATQQWACMVCGRHATHSIEVRAPVAGSESGELPFATAALVARGIAEGPAGSSQPKGLAMGVLYNGGRFCLHGIAANARSGLPLLVLVGSGRLSDYLPGAWLRRADANFNSYAEVQALGSKCGFWGGVSEVEVSLLRTVLDGRIVTHQLDNGPHVLGRVLAREFEKEEHALSDAKRRRAAYRRATASYEAPAHRMQFVYLLGGIVITLLTTIDAQLMEQVMNASSSSRASSSSTSGSTCNATAAVGGASGTYASSTVALAFKYTLAVLPVLLSALLSLRKDLNHAPKAVAFRYGYTLVDSQVWRYCTRTGVYSDLALANCGHVHDTPTARAALLADQLVAVADEVVPKDASPPKLSPSARVTPADGESRAGGDGALGGGADELPASSSIEDGDEYMRQRLLPQLDTWHATVARLQRQLLLLKTATYLVGAAGSVLALLDLQTWVAVTTAVVTALASWDAAAPVEQRLHRAQAAARSLSGVATKWQATPQERRSVQQVRDALVEVTECAIMQATERPQQQLAADENAALGRLGDGTGAEDAPTSSSEARGAQPSS